jgi:hypothetical protein
MQFTPFFPIFLLFLAYAVSGPQRWALATGILTFFQAASPLLIGGGGRAFGLSPAYCLLPIGIFYLTSDWFERHSLRQPPRVLPTPIWLFLFMLIFTLGVSLLAPRIFEGQIDILPPRFGLDSGITERLKPGTGNYIQSAYMLFNVLLVLVPAELAASGKIHRQDIIKGITIGACVAAATGLYQLTAFFLNLPWPDAVINSNLGVGQQAEQVAMGIKRMSSTFQEPSMMAQYLISSTGLILLGQSSVLIGGLIVAALLLSTSSTAYFGLILLVATWGLLDIQSRMSQVIKISLALLIFIAIAYGLDLAATDGQITQRLIFDKFESKSGTVRVRADMYAVDAFIQSFGLGVGIGSLRASSFMATLLGTQGTQGVLLFLAANYLLIRHAWRENSIDGKACALGLIGCLIGWMLSVPDISVPLYWLLAAAILCKNQPNSAQENCRQLQSPN